MAVHRTQKKKNFTTMSNYHLQDKELTLKAKGLMSCMLSLPDDWDYSIKGLASILKEGETSIKNTLKELEQAGYLKRARTSQGDGKFKYVYDIFEKPSKKEQAMKPIETEYKGYKFRSRLEARWAVFFDACKIKYEYEPEGFVLNDGTYYLPDFYLPDAKSRGEVEGIYVEVKGSLTDEDLNKLENFDKPIVLVGDIPQDGGDIEFTDDGYWNFRYIDGDEYPAARFCKSEYGEFYLGGVDWDGVYEDAHRLDFAYTKARQARFEHGETPRQEDLCL